MKALGTLLVKALRALNVSEPPMVIPWTPAGLWGHSPKSFLHRLSTISLSFSSVSLQASHTLGTERQTGSGEFDMIFNNRTQTTFYWRRAHSSIQCAFTHTICMATTRSKFLLNRISPSLVTGTTFSALAGGMHRSLSGGKRSHLNISGHGKPNEYMRGAHPRRTLSHSDLHGWMGSSRSSRQTGANSEQRNFLVSGWHCFWTRGIQEEACCRTSSMVSCPSRFGRRISVYSMSWQSRRLVGICLQLFFL